jgi:hypothetical protein
MENITNIQTVDPNTLEFQTYQPSDENLISSFTLDNIPFTSSVDKIEYHVFDANQNIIFSNYNFSTYNLVDNLIVIDPKKDLTDLGFDEGQYYTIYNFLLPLLNSSEDNTYFISEISSDRTELRLSSNILDSQSIVNGYNDFIAQYSNLNYFPDFYLNFSNNNLIIANNVLLDGSTILIKLYEPLPPQFDLKSELWVINKIADSIAYFIELITVLDNPEDIIPLKGPNLNINLKDKINNSTDYTNYTTLQTSVSSSLSNQLNNILLNKSIRLNIDYSDYSNFAHFSSAETRLENFYYKLSLIEQYNQQYLSSSLSPVNYYLTSSQNIYLNKIKEIEEGFDGYEYYLYYSSGSTAWPKSNSTKPYINYSTTSSQATTWLNGQLSTASLYDSENKDALVNAIPLYLREDSQNAPYELFVEMLGQHFDTLYLYYAEVSNKYNSDNRIDAGVSRDLISDILKDFGVKIYQNNFSTDDLYSSFLGITNNLSLLPPTGSELITNYITASNEVIPLENVNVETYKRIYHNLPLLFKKKGTVDGLRLLINLYGIPNTILRISEFGGKNKINTNNWDQFQNQFNYEFFSTGSGYIQYDIPISTSLGYSSSLYSSSFYGGTSFPSRSLSTEFRFKTTGIPTTSGFSQSLAYIAPDFNYSVVLEYTGSGFSSGSYNGSIPDPYNEYGTLKFIDNNNNSASIYLPFFDGGWWSVLVNINSQYPHTSSIYAKNKIYDGYEGNKIGFQGSSSIASGSYWLLNSQSLYLSCPTDLTVAGKTYTPFSGSFQELRLYTTQLSESVFDDYVMNPYSIEGNQLLGSQSSLNSLIFRAPLGSVLDTSGSTRVSIHPSITNFPSTESFSFISSSVYYLSGSYLFVPNREVMYLDQFPAGIKNIISDKIKIENTVLPEGDVLSPFRSLQQNYAISESYTRDVNYVEVAFSPQNEINDDIIAQLGYFNIGDYIGDPRQLVNKNPTFYPDFNRVRDYYFEKYQSNYNLKDYIRLIKYFDNSLFKLIKDFVPARTSLASGVVIKQHLLERNRYSPAQASWIKEEYTASVKSFPYDYQEEKLYLPSGGPGGVFPGSSIDFTYPGVINITQSWEYSFNGPTGLSYITQSSQDEFYNGIFKGSTILVSTGSLNGDNPFLQEDYQTLTYEVVFWNNVYTNNSTYSVPDYTSFFNSFITSNTGPGEIHLYTNPNEVTYLKINNVDFNSINQENILQNLKQISIQYTNETIGRYYVSLLSKNNTSYIYSVVPNYQFYLNDGKMFNNYNISGSDSSSFTGSSYNDIYFPSINNNIYDPNNYIVSNLSLGKVYNIPVSSTIPYINSLVDYEITCSTTAGSILGQLPYMQLRIQKFNSSNMFVGDAQSRIYSPFTDNLNYLTGSFVVEKGINYRLLILSYDITNIDPNIVFPNPFPFYITDLTASYTQRVIPNVGSLPSNIVIPSNQEAIDFEYSDYNVLEGNLDELEYSQYYDLVKYTNYSVPNSYFDLIINGDADPAPVKDYYYTLNRQIRPRYIGSRNTSDNFNTTSTSASFALQNNLKISLQPSIKEGVAYNYNTTIYEFDGGNNIKEMPNFSRISLNQILITDTTSSVTTIKPKDSLFKFTVDSQLTNNQISITQYNSDIEIPTPFTFFSSEICPEVSAYIVPSNAPGNLVAAKQSLTNRTYVGNGSIATVNVDNNGYYVTGSIIPSPSMSLNISRSLSQGNRWFITLFTGSFVPPIIAASAPLIDEPNIQNGSNILFDNAIYEITSATTQAGGYGILSCGTLPQNFQNTTFYGNGNSGALIWKVTNNPKNISFYNTNFEGLGSGNFVTSNVLPYIQENINYITEIFGNKPRN